jgi:hypothetical protein
MVEQAGLTRRLAPDITLDVVLHCHGEELGVFNQVNLRSRG